MSTLFYFLAIVNKGAINIDVQIPLWQDMEDSGYIPRSGIAGLCGS